MSDQIGPQNLAGLLPYAQAVAVASVGPGATATTVPLADLDLSTSDLAGGWAFFETGAFGAGSAPTLAPIASNTSDTLAFAADVLASAPLAGYRVWLYQAGQFNVTVSAPANIEEWGGATVAAAANGFPTVTANQGSAGASPWPTTTDPQTANYVPQGTAVAASTAILLTYGNTLAHYPVPGNGTLNIAVALSAAATLSIARNASAATPSYNALNAGTALTAAAEYRTSLPVRSGEVIDFEVSAAVTVNVLDVFFVASM